MRLDVNTLHSQSVTARSLTCIYTRIQFRFEFAVCRSHSLFKVFFPSLSIVLAPAATVTVSFALICFRTEEEYDNDFGALKTDTV